MKYWAGLRSAVFRESPNHIMWSILSNKETDESKSDERLCCSVNQTADEVVISNGPKPVQLVVHFPQVYDHICALVLQNYQFYYFIWFNHCGRVSVMKHNTVCYTDVHGNHKFPSGLTLAVLCLMNQCMITLNKSNYSIVWCLLYPSVQSFEITIIVPLVTRQVHCGNNIY